MAERVELTECLIAASTAIATPTTFPADFAQGVVRRLEITVPPGPSGLVGFRIGHSGQVIIPRLGASWVVTDDEHLSWDMDGYPTGNKWFLTAYNIDIYPHTLRLRWHLDEIPSGIAAGLAPIAID